MLLPNDFLKREKALLFPLFFQIFYLSIISVLIISSIEFRILFIFYIQSGGLVALIRSATLCLLAYSFTSRENIFSCLFVNIGEVTVRLTDSQQVVYRIRWCSFKYRLCCYSQIPIRLFFFRRVRREQANSNCQLLYMSRPSVQIIFPINLNFHHSNLKLFDWCVGYFGKQILNH